MRSPFVPFAGKLALLLVTLWATVVLGGLRIQANHPDHSDMQYEALRGAGSGATAVVFGSSTAVRAYDPEVLSAAAGGACPLAGLYNFALVGAQPSYYLDWYPRVFRPAGVRPKLAIVSLDWFSLTDWRELEQDSRYWTASEFARQAQQASAAELWTMLLNRFPLIRAGADMRYLAQKNLGPVARYDRGFLPIDGVVDLGAEDVRQYVWKPEHLQSLRQFLRDLRRHGVEVILVQLPVYNPAGIRGLDSSPRYRRVAEEAGVPFLDYLADRASPFATDYRLYEDWVHFNATGSALFSQTLRGDLERLLREGALRCGLS